MREREGYWSGPRRRRVSRRRFLLGSGVAAAGSAAMLAGCGGGEPPAPATPSAARTATPTRTPTPVPTPTATPTPDPNAPRRGGTLRLWKAAEDNGLDPAVFHVNNTEVIYATMTQACTYQPTKNLFAMDGMTGYEQVDPTTLVWSVRPGMEFHNGDPVDAEAVAFSWRRLDDLYRIYDAHTRRDGFDFVDAFETTDGLTVTERWSRPNADALVHRSRHYYSFINPRVHLVPGGSPAAPHPGPVLDHPHVEGNHEIPPDLFPLLATTPLAPIGLQRALIQLGNGLEGERRQVPFDMGAIALRARIAPENEREHVGVDEYQAGVGQGYGALLSPKIIARNSSTSKRSPSSSGSGNV